MPVREVGMPVVRAIFDRADEMPKARRAENENPNFLPISIPSDLFIKAMDLKLQVFYVFQGPEYCYGAGFYTG